jgi:hypothetical protein
MHTDQCPQGRRAETQGTKTREGLLFMLSPEPVPTPGPTLVSPVGFASPFKPATSF